jgi:hypothetical protein
MKTIFLSAYQSPEVNRRLNVHVLVDNDDDPAGGATPVVLPVPTGDEQIAATTEQSHRPWLFQEMRNVL